MLFFLWTPNSFSRPELVPVGQAEFHSALVLQKKENGKEIGLVSQRI